jgi:hypothetical protein
MVSEWLCDMLKKGCKRRKLGQQSDRKETWSTFLKQSGSVEGEAEVSRSCGKRKVQLDKDVVQHRKSGQPMEQAFIVGSMEGRVFVSHTVYCRLRTSCCCKDVLRSPTKESVSSNPEFVRSVGRQTR